MLMYAHLLFYGDHWELALQFPIFIVNDTHDLKGNTF